MGDLQDEVKQGAQREMPPKDPCSIQRSPIVVTAVRNLPGTRRTGCRIHEALNWRRKGVLRS